MLHTLKITFRNTRANSLVYGVSVLAIGLGALCISMLSIYLFNELTTDRFHKRLDDLYMFAVKSSSNSEWTGFHRNVISYGQPVPDLPGLEQVTSLQMYPKDNLSIQLDSITTLPATLVTDSAFFSMFDFRIKAGSLKQIQTETSSVLLTERFAKQLFGTTDVLGKQVKLSANMPLTSTVRGILQNPPPNSSIQFDVLVVYNGSDFVFSRSSVNFFLLNKSFDKALYLKNMDARIQNHEQFKGGKTGFIPFKGLYFSGMTPNNCTNVITRFGDKKDLYIILMVLLVLLLVTWLNVKNLQEISIQSSRKQTSIIQMLGASKRQILVQRMVDAGMMAFVSWGLSILLFFLLKPIQSSLSGLETTALTGPFLWVSLLIVVLLIVFTGGITWPINFKGNKMLRFNVFSRKASLLFQFTMTILLLITTMMVFKQWRMMTNADLGWNYDQVVRTKFLSEIPFSYDIANKGRVRQEQNYQYVNNELQANASIQSFAQGSSPFQMLFDLPWTTKGSGLDYTTQHGISISTEWAKTLDIKILEGRFFDKKQDKSREKKVVINQAAKKYWNIHSIDSCRLLNPYWSSDVGFQVIGVVEDFRYERLALPVKPLIMLYMADATQDYLIRYTPGKGQEALLFLKALHQRVNPNEPFEYSLLKDEATALYEKEKQMGILFSLMTIVIMFIALTGLFALTYHDSQRRIKEIGIRKVNGASILQVAWLLNRDLVGHLGSAFVLASIAGYILIQRWLEQFVYQTAMNWWIFALAGLIVCFVALLTVSWQSWRSATRNPVEALRND